MSLLDSSTRKRLNALKLHPKQAKVLPPALPLSQPVVLHHRQQCLRNLPNLGVSTGLWRWTQRGSVEMQARSPRK